MTKKRISLTLFVFLLPILLTACNGGSGGSSVTDPSASASSAYGGIVVDPYISGAILQEIADDGRTVLQRVSSPSDAQGRFSFQQALTEGSTIEIKVSNPGQHVDATNQVMLRRKVLPGETGELIVSPLTTLIANGSTEDDVVGLLQDAGLTGFAASDIYRDPMAGVADLTTNVTDGELIGLQAAMAVGNFLEATNNGDVTAFDLGDSSEFQTFSALLDAIQTTLSATSFQDISAQLASDPAVSNLTLGDVINAAVVQNRPVVALVKTQLTTFGYVDPAAVYDQAVIASNNMLNETKTQNQSSSTPAVDGIALYASECAACHGQLTTTDKPGRSAATIQGAIDSNIGGMAYLGNLTATEVQAIADALPAAPVTDPSLSPDGATLYASECADCHGTLEVTTKTGRTAAAIQAAIDGDIGYMGYLSSLSSEEVQAIADALPAAPVTDPSLPPDGAALYASECEGCHGPLSTTSKPSRTATAIQDAIDGNIGNMGYLSTLTSEEVQAIADVLPADTGSGGPDYSNCMACHSQPPDGTSSPNVAGAHAAHQAISSIGTSCDICHLGATHNGTIDLAFPPAYNGTGGVATDNQDGTCSNISCHGGQTTPDWWSDAINLTLDCTACHTRPSTGQHDRSEHRNRSCTTCHNSTRMATHIGDLSTPSFEVTAASTVSGSGTSVGSYSGGRCSSIACHGSENW